MTKRLMIGLSAAAFALAGAGVAYAAVNDGTTTRAEAQTHASAMFARMDVNKDGKLDTADRSARQAERFDRIDSDNNGSISPAEFSAGRGRDGARGSNRAGSDGDKRGHQMGGHAMGGRHGGGHGMGGMMLMRMADTNGDQAVSQAEFSAAALKHFDSADANKDGTLTRAERQAAHQAMRAQMQAARPAAPATN